MVTSRIISGFKATLGARLVNTLSNGLLIVLLAGVLLTPDEYGLLFLIISIVSVAQLGTDLGLARSVARFVSDRKETDPGSIPFLLRSSIRYRLLLLGVVIGLLVLLREHIAAALDTPELETLLLGGAAYLCVLSLFSYHRTLFQGFNRVDLSAVLEVTNNLGRFLFVVAFTFLGLGVVGALFGYFLGALLATAVGAVLLYRRFYVEYPDVGGSRSLRDRLLKYSVPLTASQSANVLDRQIDTILVGYFLSPAAVSHYVLGKQISEFVTVVSGSLGFSISPSFGEQKATDSLDRAARIYEQSLQYVLLFYVPAAAGLILVAEPAITLVFSEDYADAVPVLQVLGVYVVFQSVTDVTTNGLDYLGRAKARAVAKGITSVGNVFLNVLLIPIYGVVGAALATAITFGTYTLVNVYVMHLELSLDFRRIGRTLGLAAGITSVMSVSVMFFLPYVSNLPTLVAVVALGAAIWITLVTLSGFVNPREAIAHLI